MKTLHDESLLGSPDHESPLGSPDDDQRRVEADDDQRRVEALAIVQQFVKVKQLYTKIQHKPFNQRKYQSHQVYVVLKSYSAREHVLS